MKKKQGIIKQDYFSTEVKHRIQTLCICCFEDLPEERHGVSNKCDKTKPHLIIQLIGHGGFRSSGPFSTFFEVLFDQGSVGSVLKEASSPGHRSLDNLISHNYKDVSGHSSIHAFKRFNKKR